MFGKIKNIINRIKNLNSTIDEYKKDTIIQSLPSLTYVNRAKKCMREDKFVEAEIILRKALELPQKDALVYKYLGAVYEKLGNNDLAIENYQISADLEPHDKVIWQRLGFSLITAGKLEQAEKAFENSNKIQANNADTYTGWGMALMKQKKHSEAREKFMTAVKIDKYNFSALFLCAVAESNLKMYDSAETRLTFLANVSPNFSNVYELAKLKAVKDDYENAIHYAKKALSLNPKMLPAYILLGQIYGYCFDIENSLKYFNLAQEKGIDDAFLYYEWGKVLFKFERYNEAKDKMLKAYEKDSQDADVLAYSALYHILCGENADEFLQKAVEKDSEHKIVKQAYAIIDYENNEIDKAVAFFRTDDENALSCYYLARCYEKLNNDTKVRESYEAALQNNPKYITAYKNYAKYLISKEDFAEAQRKLRKALKIDENNVDLLNLMFYCSYILVKENGCNYNIKETLAIAEKIQGLYPQSFEYNEQKEELIKLSKEI